MDQLEKTSIEVDAHQTNTLAALDIAMEEIFSHKAQVAALQATQGTMVDNLDSATNWVATCEQTLQQHATPAAGRE
jgi:hypothetical protein